MKQPKSTKGLTPSEKDNIVWLSKSGHSAETIKRKTGLSLSDVLIQLREVGRL